MSVRWEVAIGQAPAAHPDGVLVVAAGPLAELDEVRLLHALDAEAWRIALVELDVLPLVVRRNAGPLVRLAPPPLVDGQKRDRGQGTARLRALPELGGALVDGARQVRRPPPSSSVGGPRSVVSPLGVRPPEDLPEQGIDLAPHRGLEDGAVVAVATALGLHPGAERRAGVEGQLHLAVVAAVNVPQGAVLDKVAAEAAEQDVEADVVGQAS